ncbi:MAG: hypothetical protein K9G49_09505 [Taibaiella sp.]|nr:hypothetical protein [Taibaiella sp.]
MYKGYKGFTAEVIDRQSIWLPVIYSLRVLMFALCLLFASAEKVVAQDLLQKVVSVDVKSKKLGEVLTNIGKQGNFYFSYNSNIIRKDSLVTVAAKGKTVKQVLDMLLGEDCQYKQTDKYIIIQPAEKEKWYTISGFITDGQSGDALPDVSVFERQQLASAITGKDGFFKLQLKDREKYRTAEITVSKGFYSDTSLSLIKGYDQELSLTIVPETYALPDVVVSGVERSWLGKLFISSKLKTQSLNLGKFFVDKPYQFSLIPGVGTHGKMSGQVANKFSMNVFGGYTAGVDGVELAGMFNVNKKDAQYVQLAGICNIVLGNTEGVQMGGISNYVERKVTGVQCAGIVNKAGNVEGVQAGGFLNIAFDTVNGVQTGGFMNVATAATVQVAGFMNIAEEIDGNQTAGFINMAEQIDGMQLAGFVNIAGEVDGMQLAGFVNVAGKVNGVQLAGFINIADSSDYPIGLVNIISKGEAAIGVSADEYGTAILALRSGGRKLYGILGVAANQNTGSPVFGMEAGLGAHFPVSKHFRINTELAVLSMSDFTGRNFTDNALRVMPAVRMGPVELFAGAGLNLSAFSYKPELVAATNSSLWSDVKFGTNAELRIGYRAGIQFHF